ncbi:MAG: TldD/PmbA family protein [Nitrospinae bacterium]|nr:TldD/PmbA family protein [Nitrospinota bacterium]
MKDRITIDLIDDIKKRISNLVTGYTKGLKGCYYADLRVEIDEGRGALSENGESRECYEDTNLSFGVRVIAGDGIKAPGYFGQVIGMADIGRIERIVKEGIDHAYRRGYSNAVAKLRAKETFGQLGKSLWDTLLAPIEIHQDKVPAVFDLDPREIPLEDLIDITKDVSKEVSSCDKEIRFNQIMASTMMVRELFLSSEGVDIDQSHALTEGLIYVVAQNEEGTQELYDYIGDQRGWEVITQGINVHEKSLCDFSLDLARDAIDLIKAEPLKSTDKEVTIVTDPHYNALLVHEIIGHPMELDRGLKYETAYAGRSWLLHDLDDHHIGEQIASPLVTAYSDPSLHGYGHYKYDDEGTLAKRVIHIDKGIFKGFMNSRQTAALLGVEPNGSFKAIDASFVPLIRMSNTVFAGGDTDPSDIISGVDDGYYLKGHRIPSISESRENFRISAVKVYRIKNGQLDQLFRNGGMTSDSKAYLMNVDAVGNDFKLYPIPNCGKGQPMQTKRLCNGAPTLRSRARLI